MLLLRAFSADVFFEAEDSESVAKLVLEALIRVCCANSLTLEHANCWPVLWKYCMCVVACCVCALALQCSVDSRKELAENIVVVGGVVGMQGFM